MIRARLGENYAAAVASPSLLSLTVNTRALIIPAGFLLPALLLLLNTRNLRAAVVYALWVIPLIVMHGIAMQERYLYPAILMSGGATALAFGMVKRWRGVIIGALLLGALATWRNPIQDAATYAAEGQAFHAQMQALATQNPPGIVLPGDLIEWNYSAESWLRYYGYKGDITITGAR